MNGSFWLALAGALALGAQTSISPCPLATNLAAVSFIGRRVDSPRNVLISGGLYAFGRVVAYVLFAFLATTFATSDGGESWTRWAAINLRGFLGPATVALGIALSGRISVPFVGRANVDRARAIVDKLGIWSAAPIGFLFAAAFCPTSAAAFLATVALATEFRAPLLFSLVFGVATALPVVVCAYFLAFQTNRLARVFGVVEKVDKASRTFLSATVVLLGVALTLKSTFEVF